MTGWIEAVDEADAAPELARAYDEVRASRGSIGNVFKLQSLNPEALAAHAHLYTALHFGESPLSRRERELIAVAVSRANNCSYCVTHHVDALGRHAKEPGLPVLVATDYKLANLSTRERAILDHAVKLTRSPDAMAERDVDALRAHGLTDREVLDVTLTASYFNFINRIANGLGVTLEDVGERYKY